MIDLAVERYGLSRATCIAGSGLGAAELADPSREIEGRQELIVLRNILRALGPEIPFALEAGLRYRATTHGIWGLLVLTSPNVAEALAAGSRYSDLSFSFNRLGYDLDSKHVRFLYGDCDNPEDLRAALVERDLGALVALERNILGEAQPVACMTLRSARPPYAQRFTELFGVMPQWQAQENALTLDAAFLGRASPHADTLAMRTCEELCRAELAARHGRVGLSGRVRVRLACHSDLFPSMEVVARELGMTTRTLRYRLGREGTSFRQLVDQSRAELAEQLLAGTELSVEQIAERLGYRDPSSFTVAFRRWTGVPPRRHRWASDAG